MATVELKQVTKHFGETAVVRALDLRVEKGEFLTFLGPSGCGKTTTLRMIAGFEQPTAGEILLDGRDVAGLPPYRRAVNTVFQSYALFPHLTVAQNVAYGLEQQRRPREEIRQRVADSLAMVRMESFAGRKPRELSGGQQQRVAVARAIVNKPSVLLLDEPLGALDLKLRKEMQAELKQLQRLLGMTFLYVTHDQEEALTMSDRIAVMNAGRLEQLGTPVEVYDRPRTRFVASFVGETNLLSGVVEAAPGGPCLVVDEVRIPLGELAGRLAGGTAHLSVRPESLHVRTAPEGSPALAGAVGETVFVGSVWKTIVRLPGGARLVASEPPTSHGYLAPGTAVYLSWAAERAVVLTE